MQQFVTDIKRLANNNYCRLLLTIVLILTVKSWLAHYNFRPWWVTLLHAVSVGSIYRQIANAVCRLEISCCIQHSAVHIPRRQVDAFEFSWCTLYSWLLGDDTGYNSVIFRDRQTVRQVWPDHERVMVDWYPRMRRRLEGWGSLEWVTSSDR